MASEVDICNLALAHLGDSATVASLDPPEGSAQAEHCARFYPIARDSLLEMHTWGFSTKRITLAQVANDWPEWAYAYAQPNDAVNILAVLAPDAADDYTAVTFGAPYGRNAPSQSSYTPQPFSCEADAKGAEIILTNQANAMLRYTAIVTDTTKFSPLFVMALSWHLSSMLAGPLLKGEAGADESKRCTQVMQAYLSQAVTSDANQRKISPQQNVPWMSGR